MGGKGFSIIGENLLMLQLAHDLNLEQSQKLVMTPRLYQAITVLQLSSQELSTYIEQQLLDNPLLELSENDDPAVAPDEFSEAAAAEEQNDNRFDDSFEWDDYFVQQYYEDKENSPAQASGLAHNSDRIFNGAAAGGVTLAEHLTSQLNLSQINAADKRIGEYLIGNIDQNGYLRVSLAEVREKLQVDPDRIEQLLSLLQGFDPPGVAARDLQECLLIQIGRAQLIDQVLISMINRHLADLAQGRLVRIANNLGVSIQEVQRAADLIKSLDPKPGRNFAGADQAGYIIPDVVVEKIGNEYVILVNDRVIPKITVSRAYHSVLREGKNLDPETRHFVENKMNAAVWLMRSIEQRRSTMYKVTSCLVELQKDFLEKGIKHLKTLNLKRVAEMIGMHVSTVSRATSNKYIQTPRGIYEMKQFFSNGLDNREGSKISAGSVKKSIQELIDGEDSLFPLNDKKISEILGTRGINISRRTVAKYRDDLGIPPTQKRRRY